MNFIEHILEYSNILQQNYQSRLSEEIKEEIEEKKSQVPDHEWWKLDDIKVNESDISLAAKYRILVECVWDLIVDSDFDEQLLKSFFEHMEYSLNQLSALEDIEEIRILFLESILNRSYNNGLADSFYKALGQKSRGLWNKILE